MNENIYLSLACLAGAVYTYYNRLNQHKKATEQSKFPTIMGKVTKSKIVTVEDRTQNENGSTDVTITYTPQVNYRYEVKGNIFENNRIAVLDQQNFRDMEKAEKYISQYAEGNDVKVYFNPNDPKESFLDNSLSKKKIDGGTWLLIGLLLAGAVYFLVNKI